LGDRRFNINTGKAEMNRSWINGVGLVGAIMALGTTAAQAHPLADAVSFSGGFIHPFSGIDHVLVMLGVGALAAVGGRAMSFGLPAAFLAAMIGGALIALAGAIVPFTELMIMVSIVGVAGLLVARGRAPLWIAAASTAVFGFFHGVAHGGEMVAGASAIAYIAGFATGTSILLAVGVAVSLPFRRRLAVAPDRR
jgi:urease accessory protein